MWRRAIFGIALLLLLLLAVVGLMWWRQWGPFAFTMADMDFFAEEPPRGLPASDFYHIYWREQRQIKLLARAQQERALTEAEFTQLLGYVNTISPAFAISALGAAVRHGEAHPSPENRKRILKMLDETLKNQDAVMRRVALRSLGQLNAVEQIPAVLPFLQSTDEEDRIVATQVLKKLGYQVQESSPGR